jgi:hypothetical protein
VLKMKCNSCNQFIYSALLAEMETVTCDKCLQTVPVQDLLVTAKGFTVHRDDFLKRIFRYQRLFNEVEKERELMERSPDVNIESKKSVDSFLATLRELLAGARKNFRLHFSEPVKVTFTFGNNRQTGRLVDLSTEGVRIEPEDPGLVPQLKGPISMEFVLPGFSEPVSVSGMVVWIRREKKKEQAETGIGVRFTDLDEAARARFWEAISSRLS